MVQRGLKIVRAAPTHPAVRQLLSVLGECLREGQNVLGSFSDASTTHPVCRPCVGGCSHRWSSSHDD